MATSQNAILARYGSQLVHLSLWPYGATARRECKSRVTLLLRDADSGQIDHMAAEPTHGPHQPCSSSSWLGARGPSLAIRNVHLNGGSMRIACACAAQVPTKPSDVLDQPVELGSFARVGVLPLGTLTLLTLYLYRYRYIG